MDIFKMARVAREWLEFSDGAGAKVAQPYVGIKPLHLLYLFGPFARFFCTQGISQSEFHHLQHAVAFILKLIGYDFI